MTNTRSATLSIRLKPETKKRLAKLAKTSGRSSNFLIADAVESFVARDKPEAAERLATRIVAMVEALRNHPRLGRVGADPGIRELVIGNTPYIILYRVDGERITLN